MSFRRVKGKKPLSMDLKDLEVQYSGVFRVESMWCFVIMPYPVGPRTPQPLQRLAIMYVIQHQGGPRAPCGYVLTLIPYK
jgi:hypothetical protein